MRTDLGVHSKASSDHALVFTPKTKDFLAVVAVFIAVLAIGLTVIELRQMEQREIIRKV
ncbi:hypothetical protein LZK73_18650 [Neorhizobium galegae]|nr:hypothetical protein LZK73_18650 [Neorhizobium galegae]